MRTSYRFVVSYYSNFDPRATRLELRHVFLLKVDPK